MIRNKGPPGAASASTRRLTSASSSNGGAWCGLLRASITSDPSQPQCFCAIKDADAVQVGRRVRARERHP